jgi:hypothetical protein
MTAERLPDVVSQLDEAEVKLRDAVAPVAGQVAGAVEPLRGWLVADSPRAARDADSDFSRLTQTLKMKLAGRN